MSAPIPSREPTTLVAGDTATWTKSLNDYAPADGWILSYAFRLQLGAGAVNVTASSGATDFTATISAAESAKMTPGLWSWAAYVTKAAERYQVGTGTLAVTPNLSAIDFSTDLRSPAKQAYDNAMVAWQSVKLGKTVSLNGRLYTQYDITELIKYVDRCKIDYAAELQAEAIANTGINPRKIGVRNVRL